MGKQKRFLSAAMAVLLAVTLTGCQNREHGKDMQSPDQTSGETRPDSDGKKTEPTGTENPPAAWTADANRKVSILLDGDNTPDSDNIVLKELEKRTGTKIEMIYVPGSDYSTKSSTMIAAGTAPDIFRCSTADAADYIAGGILAEVGQLLSEKAPNVVADTKDIINEVAVNQDGIYMVPSPVRGWGNNINIRTDWLENLGLDMPDDLESFKEVMHAFTYEDPDGNGRDDTYGYTVNLSLIQGGGRGFESIFGAFGIPKGRNIEMEDGTVTVWVKHPKFLDAVAYIKSLIDDGVVEPDYVTIPQMDMFGKLWTGVAGCMEWECVGPTNNWMPARYTEDPVPTFGFPIIKGPDGQSGVVEQYPDLTKGWVFSSACKNLEGAAEIANYCMSAEGSDLLFLGIEDVMYRWIDKENGKFEYLGEYQDSATHRAAGGFCYWGLFAPEDNAQYRTLNRQTREGVDQAWSHGIDWANITGISQVRSDYGADMDQVLNEMIADLLSTTDDLRSVYDSYMKEWETVGGSEWEEEASQLWKEQNQ